MEQFKFYAKIASTSLLRWVLISGNGLLLSAVGIFVALHLLGNNAGGGWGAAASEEPGLPPCSSAAWPCRPSTSCGPTRSRSVSCSTAYGLFDNKLLPLIDDQVASLVSAFITQQGGLTKLLGSASTLRDKLAALAGKDSAFNNIQRKAVRYGLARVRLDDIDFCPTSTCRASFLAFLAASSRNCKPPPNPATSCSGSSRRSMRHY